MTGRRATSGPGRAKATSPDWSQPQGTNVRGARGRGAPFDLRLGELHRARREEEDKMRDADDQRYLLKSAMRIICCAHNLNLVKTDSTKLKYILLFSLILLS